MGWSKHAGPSLPPTFHFNHLSPIFRRPQRLTSGASEFTLKSDRSSRRIRPYPSSSSHPTDNATPMREHPTPSSLNLTTPVLTKRKRPGLPEYTTPLPSPAVTAIPTSPALPHGRTISAIPPSSSSSSSSSSSLVPHTSLNMATSSLQQQQQQQSQQVSPPGIRVTAPKVYDSSRVADMVAAMSQDFLSLTSYRPHDSGWWQLLHLPLGMQSLHRHILSTETSIVGRPGRHSSSMGLTLPGLTVPSSSSSPSPSSSALGIHHPSMLANLLSPSKKR